MHEYQDPYQMYNLPYNNINNTNTNMEQNNYEDYYYIAPRVEQDYWDHSNNEQHWDNTQNAR